MIKMFKTNNKESRKVLELKIKELESAKEYLESENSSKQETINRLKEELTRERESRLEDTYKFKAKEKELELLETSTESEIESLQKEVEYKDKLLKSYKELPDLKSMIDNLSTLTTPSLDKLSEILKENSKVDLTKMTETLERIEERIERTRTEMHYRFH